MGAFKEYQLVLIDLDNLNDEDKVEYLNELLNSDIHQSNVIAKKVIDKLSYNPSSYYHTLINKTSKKHHEPLPFVWRNGRWIKV